MRWHRSLRMLTAALAALTAAPAWALDWNGYLQAENRMEMIAPYAYTWHEYRLALQAEAKPVENTRFFGELWLRSLGYPDASSSADLSRKSLVSPQDVDLREAYMDVRNLLTDNLRLQIGRQRVAWGRGDKINPTDNVNPDDLEDLWDYGRHLGSDCLALAYSLSETTFSVIWIPFFTPAVLPAGPLQQALASGTDLPGPLAWVPATDHVLLPPADLNSGSSLACKLSTNLAGYDFSLSYIYGRDDLPLPHTVHIQSGAAGITELDVDLIYPRQSIIGWDAAGAIGGVGCWAEAAVFFPEAVNLEYAPDAATQMIMAANGLSFPEKTMLADKPYVKYLVGADYTFPGGFYLNAQYLHGFLHERGESALENYVFANLDWNAVTDVLKLTPIGIGLEIKDFKHITEQYSFIAMPQAEYRPFDNVSLILGARWIWGAAETTFGRIADMDELYLKAKYSF